MKFLGKVADLNRLGLSGQNSLLLTVTFKKRVISLTEKYCLHPRRTPHIIS